MAPIIAGLRSTPRSVPRPGHRERTAGLAGSPDTVVQPRLLTCERLNKSGPRANSVDSLSGTPQAKSDAHHHGYHRAVMVSSDARTPDELIANLPPDRQHAISAVRKVILDNLPAGYEEGMQYGMIGYYIPLERFPDTYNGQPLGIAALANQKNHMSLYLNAVYGDPETARWFQEQWATTGKKLDMGKSCVRFRRLDDLPLDLIGETIARVPVDAYLDRYQASRRGLASAR
jgi:hypothetical protein